MEIDPLAALSGGNDLKEIRVRDVVHALETAADDKRVTSVVLDLDRFLGGGQVSLAEIGTAVDKVRAKKKPVLAFATAYTTDSYQIAAHASEIWADPVGGVAIAGPGGSRLYYKGLMDKLGVTAHIYRVGTFKSAVEPYLRADQSPEAKAADMAYAERAVGKLADRRQEGAAQGEDRPLHRRHRRRGARGGQRPVEGVARCRAGRYAGQPHGIQRPRRRDQRRL
ncbi:S49 family peptidase [Sphingopyxis sp. PET50]|uniref:S49 family peptidase n=1 Tax=Sphingopyxis sp. PET50 TaxID=2976533 RepID=UPI0021AFE739|nr:S49 family peptidase [Sphingopyxis sp. PET50]